MLRIGWIASVSVIAFGSVNAAEQTVTGTQDDNESIVADPATAPTRQAPAAGFVISGSTHSNAGGTSVSSSGVLAPALMPVTPFRTYAMTGDPARDAETQKEWQDIQAREQRLLKNPEYRDLLLAKQRFSLKKMHEDLADFLQISKQQADRLIDLLAEQNVREQSESVLPWTTRPDPAVVQAFMDRKQERQRTNEAELTALLGAAKFQDWLDYERSGMARYMVQRLADSLPDDARLRAEQRAPLLRAIAREQRKMYEDRSSSIPQGQMPDQEWFNREREKDLERMSVAHERILEAAGSILSQRQIDQLASLLQEERNTQSQRQVIFQGRAPLIPPVMLTPPPQ